MIDVLNLEWMSYSARDRNMSSLVCNYLRYQGYSVIEDSVFRGFEMIERYRPKLVFLANGTGAAINYFLVKYASLKGIKVVTLISEGNFRDDLSTIDGFIWGWNKDHYLYEDTHMQWNTRSRRITLQEYPDLEGKIRVSGGCGFDTYKIKPSLERQRFTNCFWKKKYGRIIGVGCWDFCHTYPNNERTDLKMPEGVSKRFRNDRDLFNRVLITAIKNNPSILFVLKEHPGNILGHDMSGIDGTEGYDNVLILKDYPIIDIIAVCDIWITYESTTVLEAWMLGKPTCLLNPSGIDFPRANVYLGSPNYPNEEALQNAIDVFYSTGELPGFNDPKTAEDRKKVIKDTIQWDDGLNHVRAGNEIIRVLESDIEKKKSPIPMDIRIQIIKQRLINLLKIKKSGIYQRSSSFKREEVEAFSKDLYEHQVNFYKAHNLSKEDLRKYLPL